jgi:hypothetical protein
MVIRRWGEVYPCLLRRGEERISLFRSANVDEFVKVLGVVVGLSFLSTNFGGDCFGTSLSATTAAALGERHASLSLVMLDAGAVSGSGSFC